MKDKETIDHRLRRLQKEFDELLGISNNNDFADETIDEQLIRFFGLTKSEAKVWLKQEPNYPIDRRFLTGENNRRRLYRTRNKIQQQTYANFKGTKTLPQTLKHSQNVYSEFIKHKPLETRSQCRSDCNTERHTSSYEQFDSNREYKMNTDEG